MMNGKRITAGRKKREKQTEDKNRWEEKEKTPWKAKARNKIPGP